MIQALIELIGIRKEGCSNHAAIRISAWACLATIACGTFITVVGDWWLWDGVDAHCADDPQKILCQSINPLFQRVSTHETVSVLAILDFH